MLPRMWFSSKTLRAPFSAPFLKAVIFSFLIYVLAYTYCTHAFWRDPHSYFYDRSHVYDLQYSALRETQATSYIDLVDRSDYSQTKAGPGLQICAAFVTVQRQGKNYIDVAIASMLDGLTEQERQKLYLYILFANPDPTKHDSWHEEWIEKAVDAVESYNVTAEKLEYLKDLEERKIFQEKGIFDYLYVLDACYNTGAPYVAIFEDDIIIAEGWMAKTLDALREISLYSKAPGDKFWNWIYLRLFFTETFMTWETKHDFWYRHLRWTFILASTTGFVLLVATRKITPNTKRWLDGGVIAVICLLTIPAFVDLAFKIGKYSLFPPHGVFVMNEYGCCSQALIFPRPQVPGLAAFLKDRHLGQTDSFIEDYSGGNDLTRLALAPQLVQHMGTVSSRDTTSDVSRSIFAYWFEAQDSKKLKREHEQLVKMRKYEE